MGEIMNEKRICLNQSVLDFMDSKLDCHKSVAVEFGSGWSTPWFAARCHNLITVETDRQWADKVTNELNALEVRNCLMLITSPDPARYRRSMHAKHGGLFDAPADLVLVDCVESCRYEAAVLGWQLLRPNGWLVFDDAQRPRHKPALDWLNSVARVTPTRLEWQPGDIETAKERLALAWAKP
jgi:predicted O-methyltransferase YrrM